IEKSSTTTLVAAAGQIVPYSYLVSNTGNVTLTGLTVTDDKGASVSCPATTLAVGANMTCTGSHTVSQAEIDAGGNLANLATADSDQTRSETGRVGIPIQQNAGIAIDKTSTTTLITAAGQIVPYSYLVSNTGNVTLTGITVTDDKVASVSCPATTLAVGANMTCTGSHTVSQAEIDAGGNLVNLATADSDQTGPTTDTVSIPIIGRSAQILPTNTTCQQFLAGSGQDLTALAYGVKSNKINSI